MQGDSIGIDGGYTGRSSHYHLFVGMRHHVFEKSSLARTRLSGKEDVAIGGIYIFGRNPGQLT